MYTPLELSAWNHETADGQGVPGYLSHPRQSPVPAQTNPLLVLARQSAEEQRE